MKYFISIAAWFFCSLASAQKNSSLYPGYILYSTSDTFYTNISFKGHIIETSDLFNEVIFYNKSQRFDTVSAGHSIKGFGFSIDTNQYHFIEIEVGSSFPESGKFFGWRVIDGPVKLINYSYMGSVLSTYSHTKTFVEPEPVSHRYIAYFLQKGNGDLERPGSKFGLNAANTIYYDKNWLKKFFKEDKELVAKIGKEIGTDDLETMVREYNEWVKRQKE